MALIIRVVKGIRSRLNDWVEQRELPSEDTVLKLPNFQILIRNPRKSLIGRSLYQHGVWEAEETAAVKAVVSPGDKIVDIGADIGYYTLLFWSLTGRGGYVYSFEPNPSSKAWLDRNIELNKASNISSFATALYDTAGEVLLAQDQIALDPKNPDVVRVTTQRFDDWRTRYNLNRVDLVKIDAEGAEMRILRGMEKTIASDRPKLLIEIHSAKLPDFSDSAGDVIKFLEKSRYLVRPVDRQDLNFQKGNVTVLCRPIEQL